MSDTAGARDVVDPVAKAGYELEFEDTFDGDTLDPSRWLYAAEWTPEYVAFFVDHKLVKLVEQSPTSPMQFMLNIYEFPDEGRRPIRRVPIPRSSPSTTSAGIGAPRRHSTPDSTLDVRE